MGNLHHFHPATMMPDRRCSPHSFSSRWGFDNDHLGTLMPCGAPSTPSFAGWKKPTPEQATDIWPASPRLSDCRKLIAHDLMNRAPQVVALVRLLDDDGCVVVAVEGHLIAVSRGKHIGHPS